MLANNEEVSVSLRRQDKFCIVGMRKVCSFRITVGIASSHADTYLCKRKAA